MIEDEDLDEKTKKLERICKLLKRDKVVSLAMFRKEAENIGVSVILSIIAKGEKQRIDERDNNLLFQCARALRFFASDKEVRIAMITALANGVLPEPVLEEIAKILSEQFNSEIEETIQVYIENGLNGLVNL